MHNLSDVFPQAVFANCPRGTDTPYGVATLAANAEYKYFPIDDCAECPIKQTDGHTSKDSYCIVHQNTNDAYYGSNPISLAQRPDDIYSLLCRAQEFLYCLGKWTAGWASNMQGGLWGISLFNCQDFDGNFGYNFIDILWFDATVVDEQTLSLARGNHDMRSLFGNSAGPQAGDLALIGGNNLCAGAMPLIVPGGTQFNMGSDGEFENHLNFVIKLNQELTGISERIDLNNPHSVTVGIARENSFPQVWPYLQYPDYFYGVKKTVYFQPGDAGWSTGTFLLKNGAGENCCVAAPNPNPKADDEVTLRVAVRDAATGEWELSDCSGIGGEQPRSMLHVAARQVTGTPINIRLKFKSYVSVLSGMLSTTAGSISGLSYLASPQEWSFNLSTSGLSKREITIQFTPSAGLTDNADVPAQAATLRLFFDADAPVITLTEIEPEEGASPAIKHVLLSSTDAIEAIAEADLTTNNCTVDSVFRRSATEFEIVLIHHDVYGQNSTVQLGAGKVANVNGIQNGASNQLILSAVEGGGSNPCTITSAVPFYSNDASVSCSLDFAHDQAPDVTAAMFDLVNCQMSNLTKVSARKWTFDLAPKKVEWDEDESEYVYTDVAETVLSATFRAGETEYNDGEGGLFPNEASNILRRVYWSTGETPLLVAGSPNQSNGVEALVTLSLNRECDLAADDVTVSSGTLKNFYRDGNDYSWSIVPAAAATTVTCKIVANKFQDLAGNWNLASNTLTFAFYADGTGTLQTANRLYITHDFGDTDHSTAVSTLYLGSNVAGNPNFVSLLDGKDMVRVDYFYESVKSDYQNKAFAVYSRRCRYSIPDKGGTWGNAGHDGKGWTWYCALHGMRPRGLKNYGSACYLCNTCPQFEAMRYEDFLTPEKILLALRELWVGYPFALMQMYAGDSSRFNWRWCRVNHPSIYGFLTPSDQFKNAVMPGVAHWQPQECGNFCYMDEEGNTKQGVATVILPEEDTPVLNYANADDGVLPTAIENWTAGKTKQLTATAHDEDSDPYKSRRNWPGRNAWGSYRIEPMYYTGNDAGPMRYASQAMGNAVSEEVLLGGLGNASGDNQTKRNGIFRNMWLDEDFQPTSEGAAVYGSVVRLFPMAWTPENGDNIAQPVYYIRRVEAVEGGLIQIQVEPRRLTATQGMVIPGYGQVTALRYFYAGGNLAGLPEWCRGNNEGLDYLNNQSYLWAGLGPEKGAREGYSVAFGGGVGPCPQKYYAEDEISGTISETMRFPTPIPYTVDGYSGTYHEPHLFRIKKVEACAGDAFGFDQGQTSFDDETNYNWYMEYIHACAGMIKNGEHYLNHCDVLTLEDPDGYLAAKIAAEELQAGDAFSVMNGQATFCGQQQDPDFWFCAYGESEWTRILAADVTCINKAMGLFAIKKTVLFPSTFCLRATCQTGRASYTAMISAKDLREPVQAFQALDTCAVPVVLGSGFVGQWGYYGFLSGPTGAPYIDGDGPWEYPDGFAWTDIKDSLGGWSPPKHWGSGWTLADGSGRFGDTKTVWPLTSEQVIWIELENTWPYAPGLLGPWNDAEQLTPDYAGGLSMITAPGYYTNVGIVDHFWTLNGGEESGYDASELLQITTFSQALTAIKIPVIEDMLPKGVTIEDAWADITIQTGTTKLWDISGYVIEGGHVISHWNDPEYYTLPKQVILACGANGDAGNIPTAWDGEGNPTSYISDFLGAVGTTVTFDSTDPEYEGQSPTLRVGLIGITSSGAMIPLGASVDVLADGEPHRIQVREIIRELYANRKTYETMAFLVQHDAHTIPAINITGSMSPPLPPGQEEDGPLQCLKVYRWESKSAQIVGATAGMDNLVVKWTLDGVASTIMCGGGVPFLLPAMG